MTVYTCNIPAGTLVVGTNTITLGVTSSRSGSDWLSPNYVSEYKHFFLPQNPLIRWLTFLILAQILDFLELYY